MVQGPRPAAASIRGALRMRPYEADELAGTLDCQQTQEMTSKSEQDRYSQRPSWPPLHMLAIIHVAGDMKRQQRTKSQRRADHRSALVVQMHHCRCREIVTLVSRIHNSLTVIGVDMIYHEAVVEMTDLISESNSYQADVTAMDTAKTMYQKTLELLK